MSGMYSVDAEYRWTAASGTSCIPGRPPIFPMPPNPLALLRKLHHLLKVSALVFT